MSIDEIIKRLEHLKTLDDIDGNTPVLIEEGYDWFRAADAESILVVSRGVRGWQRSKHAGPDDTVAVLFCRK